MKLKLPIWLEINWLFTFFLLFIFIACTNKTESLNSKTERNKTALEFYGNTQGTTFAVICNDSIQINYKDIEVVLVNFDLALSTYKENSIISRFNEAPVGLFEYEDSYNYFNRCFILTKNIFSQTSGSFDPTLYPLIDAWGFYSKNNTVLDSHMVDSLSLFTGFNNDHLRFITVKDSLDQFVPKNSISKRTPGVKLDFNGIAQGLAVDILSELLLSRGAKNFYVEIGGEIRNSGMNKDGIKWRIGIDKPIQNSNAKSREIQEVIQLTNMGIATSGSYRNFFESGGKSYSHTINPKTGFPVDHKLISATVVAKTCAEADALATVCMVMGPEKSIDFFSSDSTFGASIYLIYKNNKGRVETYMSSDFSDLIVK